VVFQRFQTGNDFSKLAGVPPAGVVPAKGQAMRFFPRRSMGKQQIHFDDFGRQESEAANHCNPPKQEHEKGL
jgi:hypothetical protein